MGMAASQINFLRLTSRKHDIGRRLQHLSLEKMSLTRDMQALTREYQQSLSSKTLKWSNNSGVTYTDLSYNTLMSPNLLNSNKPVLISDASGRIVLNDKYAEYAKLISEGGAPGGDYASHRAEILSGLAGVTTDQISASSATSAEAAAKKKEMEEALQARNEVPTKTYTSEKFISTFLNASTLGIDKEITSANAASNAAKIKNAFSGKNYFAADKFQDICKNIDDMASTIKDDPATTADEFVEFIASAFSEALGDFFLYEDRNGNGTRSDYEAADAKYQAALAAYQEAAGINNQVYTGAEDKQVTFYDRLFTAVAEQGWVNDSGVDDNDYINQMLQNNSYYITTMEEDTSDNSTGGFIYDMDTASNYNNIFVVNDTDARDEALVDYEYKKSLINAKESKIDTMMTNLETEQSAIVKMMESVNQVKGDNIERTFNIFT